MTLNWSLQAAGVEFEGEHKNQLLRDAQCQVLNILTGTIFI